MTKVGKMIFTTLGVVLVNSALAAATDEPPAILPDTATTQLPPPSPDTDTTELPAPSPVDTCEPLSTRDDCDMDWSCYWSEEDSCLQKKDCTAHSDCGRNEFCSNYKEDEIGLKCDNSLICINNESVDGNCPEHDWNDCYAHSDCKPDEYCALVIQPLINKAGRLNVCQHRRFCPPIKDAFDGICPPIEPSTEQPPTKKKKLVFVLPSSSSTEQPPAPSSPSTEQPPEPSSPSTEQPPAPSSPSTEQPPAPSSPSTEEPPTSSSPSTEEPPTPSSPSTEKPPTPSSLTVTSLITGEEMPECIVMAFMKECITEELLEKVDTETTTKQDKMEQCECIDGLDRTTCDPASVEKIQEDVKICKELAVGGPLTGTGSSGLAGGAIAGIVLGVLVGLPLLGYAGYMLWTKFN